MNKPANQGGTPLSRRRISRRALIHDGVTATAAAAFAVSSDTSYAQSRPDAPPAASAPATRPATDAGSSITVGDVAGADRIAGRDHVNNEERLMMLRSLEGYRKRLRAYREAPIDAMVEPAISFDPRLAETEVPAGPSVCVPSEGRIPEYDGDVESLAFASVAELSRLIKARRVTSLELTRMYLDRLKRYGPRLLCVINLTEERALSEAKRADEEMAAGTYRGPLHGIPYGAKDLLAARGAPTTYGVSPFKEQVFDFDATVVRRLEAAGAVLLGKLSLGELAMGDVWFGGRTRTPWNGKEGSSGSSAGSCAATAAGLVGFAIGSETQGSIVSPCVVNGTTGLRPTWGRISRFGALPLTWTMDKLGPICRGVEDCALVLAAVAGRDDKDPTAADVAFRWDPDRIDVKGIRVGYDPAAFDWNADRWKDESLRKLYQAAFDQIKSMVGEMRAVKLPSGDRYSGLANTIIGVESSSAFGELLTSGRIRELVQQHSGAWPNTFRAGATVPAADYLRAQRLRMVLMREMHDAMEGIEVMVTVPFVGQTLGFTNLTGHPSLVTRGGMHGGRPKMIEFIGNLYREDAICAVGFAYERMNGWGADRPDLSVLPETPEPL